MRVTVPADRFREPPKPGDRMLVVDGTRQEWAPITAAVAEPGGFVLDLDAADGWRLVLPAPRWWERVTQEVRKGRLVNVVRNVSGRTGTPH